MRDEPADEHPERAIPGPPRPASEHYRTPGVPTRVPVPPIKRVMSWGGYLFLVSVGICAAYGLWLVATGAVR